MERALLIIRLPVETAFGLLYMTGLLLLPSIFRGYSPLLFLVAWLGMPRHTNGPMLTQAELHYLNHAAMLAGLLLLMFLVLNGLLWFKNVFNIIRKLRAKQQTPRPFSGEIA